MRILDRFLTFKFRLAPALENFYIDSSNWQPFSAMQMLAILKNDLCKATKVFAGAEISVI